MTQYIIAILAIIVAILLIKKFVGCMIRTIITFVLIAILIALYYAYCNVG